MTIICPPAAGIASISVDGSGAEKSTSKKGINLYSFVLACRVIRHSIFSRHELCNYSILSEYRLRYRGQSVPQSGYQGSIFLQQNQSILRCFYQQ